jgi:hypothetical protein
MRVLAKYRRGVLKLGVLMSLAVGICLTAGAGLAWADVSVNLTTSQSDPSTSDTVTYTAQASGAGCHEDSSSPSYTYAFAVDGTQVQAPSPQATYTTTWSSANTSHTVTVDAQDATATNCTGPPIESPSADTSLPVNVFSPLSTTAISQQPTGAVTQGGSVTMSEAPSGGDGTYSYDWYYGSDYPSHVDATGATIQRRFLSSGSQPTYVTVTDGATPAHTVTSSINTQVNEAPALGGDISYSPSGTIPTGSTVTFTAPGVGGVPPYSYAWSFTCKEYPPSNFHDAYGQVATKTFTQQGTYNICVNVTDSAVPAHSYAVATQVTVGSPAPPSTCTPPETRQTVTISSIAEATGCFQLQSNGNYTSDSTVTLNGVPLTPAGTTPLITITPGNAGAPGGNVSIGEVEISLGDQDIYDASLSAALPDPSTATATASGTEATFFTKTAKPISLFGLKVGGTFTLNLGKDAGGYYSAFTLTIDLPSVFKNATGSGGVTGTGSVRVNQDGTVEYNGANIDVSGAEIGGIGVKDVCFSLIPAASGDVSSCPIPSLGESATGDSAYLSCAANPGNGDHWDASAEIELPTPDKADIAVFGGGAGTSLTDLGGFGQNLNIPIADGVFLNTVGAGVCFTSPLTIRGDLGVGLFPVPDKGDTVDISGTLIYTDATASAPWSLYLGGTVDVFGDQVGSGDVTVYGDGSFDFDANLSFDPVSFLSLDGGVSGWVEPAQHLFDIEGNINVCVKVAGQSGCAGANGVVSSTGAAGCLNILGISVGAGYLWASKATNVMAGSCSVGAYQATKASAAAGGVHALHVAPGTRGIAVGLTGKSGPPKLLIRGPGGTRISSPAVGGLKRGHNYLIIDDPATRQTDVLLAHPQPGTYEFSSTDTSNPIVGLKTAPVLAAFSAHARVTAASRGRRRLTISYVLPTGSKLALLERGKHVERTLVANVHGRACQGEHKRVVGGSELCFSTLFTPTNGPGGVRRIMASVQRGGIPSAITAVASYKAPALKLLAKPAKLRLTRQGNSVRLAWARIAGATSYAVSVVTSDGRTLSFLPAARCRAVKLTSVASSIKLAATVEGIRFDGVRGRRSVLSLPAKRQTAGAKHALSGPVCS